MKALPPALRNGLLRMRRDGATYATISQAFGLPVGTVKSVCSKEGVRQRMEPQVTKGKTGVMEPGEEQQKAEILKAEMMKTEMVHRGLRLEDMPGRTGWERRSTWALFKRGQWPPLHWHIPVKLAGDDLRALLMERAAMFRPKGVAEKQKAES